jgi:hypothetical protein
MDLLGGGGGGCFFIFLFTFFHFRPYFIGGSSLCYFLYILMEQIQNNQKP